MNPSPDTSLRTERKLTPVKAVVGICINCNAEVKPDEDGQCHCSCGLIFNIKQCEKG